MKPKVSVRPPAMAGIPPTNRSRSATRWSGLGTLPFVSQPGEAFVYGYNTDILGCVVEKASGMPLDEFVRTRITEPLGMKDTRFLCSGGGTGAVGGRLYERQRWADCACA